MHPFSILTLAIFVAGYITARWDLVTRLYELAIFAWDHGVVVGPKTTRLPRTDANVQILDAYGQRIRNSLDLLLPIHRTCGETGF
jgi:hypothetical protein